MKSSELKTRIKCGIITCIVIITATKLKAQSKIKLYIIDSVSNMGVEFATASISEVGKNITYKYGESDSTGLTSIENVRAGKYILKISHLNYNAIHKEITVNKNIIDLGRIKIKEKSSSIYGVTITALANPILVKKDTIEFNTAAFPVKEGDNLEQLLKLLPGLEIDNKGKITYNGKPINKILVDGKNFLLSDPKAITSNLPANIVDKIKVIDRKSDQARFTGVDDGNSESIMDVSIKDGFKKGAFGNASAGVGTANSYKGSLFTAKFDKKMNYGLSINSTNVVGDMGMNIGIGSGGEQAIMFVSGAGNIKANTITLSGEKESKSGKFKMDLGYFLSENKINKESKRTRQTFLEDGFFIYNQSGTGDWQSFNHTFGTSIDWKPTKKIALIFRQNIDFISSDAKSSNQYTTLSNDLTPINEGFSKNLSENKSNRFTGELLVMYSFNKPRRTFSLSSNYNFSSGETINLNNSTTIKYDTGIVKSDTINQKSNLLSDNYGVSLRAAYTEPISQRYLLELSYNLNYNNSLSDKIACNWNPITENYDIKDDVYSNEFDQINFSQKIDANIQMTEKKYNYRAGVSLQPSFTKSEGTQNYSSSVLNYSPSFNLSYNINKTTFLRVNYNGYSQQPLITSMQPVLDNSNPLYIRAGNPGLLPSFRNSFDISLRGGSKEKSNSIDLRLSGGLVINNLVNLSAYGKGGVQYSIPINSDNTYTAACIFSVNTPLIKKNVFISLSNFLSYNNSFNYTATIDPEVSSDPSKVILDNFKDIIRNKTNYLTNRATLRITCKFKIVDFSIGNSLTYSNVWYSQTSKNKPEIWGMKSDASLNVNLPWDFKISGNMNFNVNKGYGGDRDNPYTILNGEVNKGFAKNKFNLKLYCFDILNQSRGINRQVTDNYIEDSETTVQKQFFMLSLTYKFGVFPGSRNF